MRRDRLIIKVLLLAKEFQIGNRSPIERSASVVLLAIAAALQSGSGMPVCVDPDSRWPDEIDS